LTIQLIGLFQTPAEQQKETKRHPTEEDAILGCTIAGLDPLTVTER
jgi:hypothetical protein